jgi:hypothetical protein
VLRYTKIRKEIGVRPRRKRGFCGDGGGGCGDVGRSLSSALPVEAGGVGKAGGRESLLDER